MKSNPWQLLAAPLRDLARPGIPARDFFSADFGVRGDAKKDDRPALQAALDACAAADGGRVIVPAGDYFLRGPLRLRSRVELHLAEGATLRFAPEPSAYLPAVLTRWEGTLCYNYSPLVYAHRAHDVALTGGGVLDGGADAEFATWRSRQKPAQDRLRAMGAEGVAVGKRIFGKGDFLRPSFFQPLECERVLVEGVTFRNAPFWIIHPTFCRNVVVRGVTVDSHHHNNDGCDPDSCTDVLIEGCTFRTGDDAVALKSGRDRDGWLVARPTQRVLVRDCELSSKLNGLCLGSEMSGGIRHVFLENCRVGDATSVLYAKGNLDRGGVIEHVFARDIVVGRARAALIRCESAYHSHRGGDAPPVFRHFEFSNVNCQIADTYGFSLEGTPAAPLRDIRIGDVTIERAGAPYWFRHGEAVVFNNVRVSGESLPVTPTPSPPTAQRLKMAM